MSGVEQRWVPDWDGAAYAANTGHHREHDAWFLRAFPIEPTDRVLAIPPGPGPVVVVVVTLLPEHAASASDASTMTASTRATSDAVNRSEPERARNAMQRVCGCPSGTASSHIIDAGRPPSGSGRSCDRCTSGAPRARARRPAGTSLASSIGATQTFVAFLQLLAARHRSRHAGHRPAAPG